MRKAYCQDVCECIQKKKTIVRKRTNQKKEKKSSNLEKNKKIKYVVYVFVFLHADKKLTLKEVD